MQSEQDRGYEKCAHLYHLFDAKENIEFFFHYASEAGQILDIGAGTGCIVIPPYFFSTLLSSSFGYFLDDQVRLSYITPVSLISIFFMI